MDQDVVTVKVEKNGVTYMMTVKINYEKILDSQIAARARRTGKANAVNNGVSVESYVLSGPAD